MAKIIFGSIVYAAFFGVMALGLIIASQEYPDPPAATISR